MKLVHERYEKLHSVVDLLTDKTKRLMLRERRNSLAAYRAHTSDVHAQLLDLRQRVADQRLSCQTQGKLDELRDENDWFRTEALRLIKLATAKEDELHALKDELEMAESDRDWLRTKLTSLKGKIDKLPKPVVPPPDVPQVAVVKRRPPTTSKLVDRKNEILLRTEVLKKDCKVLRHILATRQDIGDAPSPSLAW